MEYKEEYGAAIGQERLSLAELTPMLEVAALHDAAIERTRNLALLGGKILINTAGAVVGAGVALNLFPYNTELAGVPTEISVSTGIDKGVNGDSTFGDIKYPTVDGLPIGLHITPKDIDLAALRSASGNSSKFAKQAQAEFNAERTRIKLHFALTLAAGGLVGAGVAESIRRALWNKPSQLSILRNAGHMGIRAVAGATAMTVGVASYGWATYNPEWRKNYTVTGLLADIQAVPGKLAQMYGRDTTAANKVKALIALENQLTQSQQNEIAKNTAYNVLFISDMHLRNMYPYLEKIIEEKNVKVIINTGDETEYGTAIEMTKEYRDGIGKIAAEVPFIWVAGNHDSPDTVKVMQSIPGVIVLGDKVKLPDSTFHVSGKRVAVYGLNVAGVPDPRVYGGGAALYGADNSKITDPLEHAAMKQAIQGFDASLAVDIVMTHEPVAVTDLQKATKARLAASGHSHRQNDPTTLQSPNGDLNFNEGSTGMGGLDSHDSSPMEFSIMAVAPDCQFTEVTRYQLSDPAADGRNSNALIATYALKPQKIASGRICSVDAGVGKSIAWQTVSSGNPVASGKNK